MLSLPPPIREFLPERAVRSVFAGFMVVVGQHLLSEALALF